jgi:hypothetical protein
MNHVKDIFWIFSNAPIWLMQNPHQLLAVRTLTLDMGVSMTDPTTYRAILGSLQYLSLTQPDICFTVNKLSQFMHKSTDIHWQIVKRHLRYLQGTIQDYLLLHRHSSFSVHAFFDANWDGNKQWRS